MLRIDEEEELNYQTNHFGNYFNRVEEIDLEEYYNPGQPEQPKKKKSAAKTVIENDFGNYSNRVERIDLLDRKPSKKSKYSEESKAMTVPFDLKKAKPAPVVDLKGAKESIEKTLQFIQEKNYRVEKPSITDELTFDNLITAANTGYEIYLQSQQLTFFSNTSPLNNSKVLSIEDRDHLSAIELQNQEIRNYISQKSRK